MDAGLLPSVLRPPRQTAQRFGRGFTRVGVRLNAAKVVERGSGDLPRIGRPCRLAWADHLAEPVTLLAELHNLGVGARGPLRPCDPADPYRRTVTMSVEAP
jgi:hypothetical protein